MTDLAKEHFVTTVTEDHETACWGCGLRLLLPSYTPIFKCGWCGAITNQNESKRENKYFWWRRTRDRCFVFVLLSFMLFVISGGVWAVYPVVFSISFFCGAFHLTITIILSISTILFFSLAAFRCPGKPPTIEWGSYPVVAKGYLESYTFCTYCSKPKSPRTHHCRSCGMCVLDMDHHCPFIGNCVGASNHRHFIAFLISAVVSIVYVSAMSVFAGLYLWPPITIRSPGNLRVMNSSLAWITLREIMFGVLSSALLLSARGLVLVYLFICSIAMGIGLTVLLWQQLCYIYEGKTYLSHLSSQGRDEAGQQDCKNIFRFFGWPYPMPRYLSSLLSSLPMIHNSPKTHKR